ncbi:response regulator [Ramlibacter tataouinensis]|uniref:hybrid sensor histidine kinase/response regulator n=1 Tax=Ramlibacter tataouinensis TaxID=94132 RepID=UPI0022F3F30A|nr:hybrid sensor histidine kinase/response regulator [Ramlibacter tataouinensis]WBY01895.1 response regulator [Ramlibacter tataouinensis]
MPSSPSPPPGRSSLQALRWLPWLCLLLPLLAWASVGVHRYQQMRSETEVRLDRALRIASEHALRVMDTTESLLARVVDIAARPGLHVEHQQAGVHALLSAMAQNKPQLQSILVFGTDGRPLVSSRLYPAPPIDASDRDYFRWHQQGRGGVYVSRPLVSRVTGESFFDVSTARRQPDGSFGGVVSIRLLTDYFEQFHRDLAADEPGLAINLLREDGLVFTRWPVLRDAPERLAHNSPVMSRIRAGARAGTLHGVSSIDGRPRLLAFRRVGDYPIYLGTGMDTLEIRKRWLREMGWLAAFGAPPAVALFLAVRLALRRSGDALASAHRLQQETEARRRVEEALLQAQKLEALGRLTGGVAHDFNNALMVISNNLLLLRMKQPPSDGPYLDSIRRVASATKLTRQLLAFSRRQALVPEQVRLQERLPAIRDLLGPVLGSRTRLEITVEPDTRPIRVDAAEFELALLNLAINARDALEQDGLLALCARNAGPGELPPLVQGPLVMVEVADNGRGIPRDVLDRVFEPFFTTKPVGEGTGLGLSQVYGLAQRAGGTATVASEPGRGTQVRMFFPPDERPPPKDDTLPSLGRALALQVLMVEDNAEVAAALAPVLEALGCRVTHFDRAGAALAWLAAQERLPDVLLTDVVMPGEMDGVALARAVRQRWPSLRVIVMTGYAEQLDVIAQQGFDILPKPCTPEMLVQTLGRGAAAT